MGNKQSEHTAELTTHSSNKSLEIKEKLKTRFQKSVQEEEKQILTSQNFQRNIFPDDPDLSDRLFDYFQKTSTTEEIGLNEDTFLSTGCAILELEQESGQEQFCFSLFVDEERRIDKSGFRELIKAAFLCSCELNRVKPEPHDGPAAPPWMASLTSSLFEGDIERVDLARWESWTTQHCERMLNDMYEYIRRRLLTDVTISCQIEECKMLDEASTHRDNCLLSIPTTWLLSSQIAHAYFPSGAATSSSLENQLFRIALCGWKSIYTSVNQGLSINRLQHHVFAYSASTVTLLSFESHLFCICCTSPWREDSKQWGGSDCCLLQLIPRFKVMQTGDNLMFVNFKNKSLPKGIHIGSDPKTRILQIDGDLHKVTFYGTEYPLHNFEVWGCGDASAHEKQQQQREWEKRDAQRLKERKLKPDDWEDSPDRQLLNMGGVTTRHAQR